MNQEINHIEVEKLQKYFGKVRAVDGVDFTVRKGEIFGLLGPNGAGKTTIVKCLLGMLEPTDGSVSIFGLNPETDDVEIKKRLGYVSEEPLIYKSLTPRQLFNFIASIRQLEGPEVSKRLAEYLESLNALEYYDRIIATLSRGNKQKTQIIAAIMHSPELLILDEPFSGLDAKSQRVFKEIIKMHTENGGSVIFSTHILETAEVLCDRIGIINKGKIVAIGTIDELRGLAQEDDRTLEDIFLYLTEQDEAVDEIINNLKNGWTKKTSQQSP